MKKWIVFCWILSWIAKVVFSIVFMTCRVEIFGQKIETEYLNKFKGKGLLYASWHRGLMFFVYFYRKLKFIVMASASRDGEIAAQTTRRFGWIPVRGSSTRKGSEALKEMHSLLEKGHRGGLVVDAPTGPPYISKIGIIVLAKRTGLPIVPVMWNADKSWRINSWDRSVIPKPFSNIVFVYGDSLMYIPENASRESCEKFRQQLDDQLRKLMYQTNHFFRLSNIKDLKDIEVPQPAPDKET